MDLGRAVETQRDALLRLLAGWGVVVEVLSYGPFAGAMPHWLGSFISSLLSRAEIAADYLVIASAKALARQSGAVPEGGWSAVFEWSAQAAKPSGDRVTSTQDLKARIDFLAALLKDLPRYAALLLRRIMQKASQILEPAHRAGPMSPRSARNTGYLLADYRWLAPCVERPPDKAPHTCDVNNSRPFSGREPQVFAPKAGSLRRVVRIRRSQNHCQKQCPPLHR